MIKFGKGATPAEPLIATMPAGRVADMAEVAGVLEWWQRPSKYARNVIDDKEIETINAGGADIIFN